MLVKCVSDNEYMLSQGLDWVEQDTVDREATNPTSDVSSSTSLPRVASRPSGNPCSDLVAP